MLPRNVSAASSQRSTMQSIIGTGSGNLLYNGGVIQTAPKIYLVLWGNWNASGDPNGVAARLEAFLPKIGGSSWLNSVTQYTQSGGAHVGNLAGSYGGVWNDTANAPLPVEQDSDVANEAVRAAAHFGDYSSSASYVIASPHLSSTIGFQVQYCAWHSSTTAGNSTIAFTNLPYIPDAGSSCGQNSVNSNGTLDGVSIVEGHEQGETETDPQPSSGWLDASGNENGDKCAWTGLQNNPSVGNYPTQPLWSNASSSCVQSY